MIDIKKLELAFDKLCDKAERKGLTPLYYGVGQFFQEDISVYRTQDHLVHIIVHPPFVRRALLNVLKRIDVPIMLNEYYMADIRSPTTHLLVNKDLTTFAEMTEFEFSQCSQWSNVFYCPSAQVLRKDTKQSCLLALYRNNNKLISQNCEVELKTAREIIVPLSRNDFEIVSPHRPNLHTICSDPSILPNQTLLKTMDKFTVPSSCTASTDLNTVKVEEDLVEKDRFAIKPATIEFDQLFPHLNQSLLPNLTTTMKLIDNSPKEKYNILRVWQEVHKSKEEFADSISHLEIPGLSSVFGKGLYQFFIYSFLSIIVVLGLYISYKLCFRFINCPECSLGNRGNRRDDSHDSDRSELLTTRVLGRR